MGDHQVLSHEDWIEARKVLLKAEKEFSRLRDELSQQIRDLPWEKVEKDYVFNGPDGRQTLSALFEGRSQLIVYHFMFGPNWPQGCPACSMCADHYEPAIVHLNQRDVTMVTVSRAPLDKLQVFQKRMGWGFKWFSSQGNDFNQDYQVSASGEAVEKKEVYYNYGTDHAFQLEELPGMSVFYKDSVGRVFHTYSTYARGLDSILGVYRFLDVVPKGRDEADLPYPMAWVRHHDRYGEENLYNL